MISGELLTYLSTVAIFLVSLSIHEYATHGWPTDTATTRPREWGG